MKYIAVFFILYSFFNIVYAEETFTDTKQILPLEHSDYEKAEVIILNKITAKSEKTILTIGNVSLMGDLSFILNRCVKWNRHNISEYLAHLTIKERIANQSILFSGWLFSNNLSINSFQNPVFEVMMVKCIANKSQEAQNEQHSD